MDDAQQAYTWTPPVYSTDSQPRLLYCTKLPPNTAPESAPNFPRSARWSPDGSTLLAQCENRTFELIDLPTEALQSAFDLEGYTPTCPSRTLPQSGPILEYAWYPGASRQTPATYCFAASVRECPVKLLDATDGRLRASYRIVDHRERQIAPHSLAFNLTADKLYCGFEDAIEVFDVSRPGEGTRLATTPSKKTKEGLKGIISALSFSPSYDFYGAGSLSPPTKSSPNIALFSETEGATPVSYIDTGIAGVRAGVTQLQFHPTKPHIMYASFRRHDQIYSWDLRGDVSNPIQIFDRTLGAERALGETTNQKLRFDIDLGGRWLGVGDQSGGISLFNLTPTEEQDVEATYPHAVQETAPSFTFKAHEDAVGSVAFHPLRSLILSVSGSRHFEDEEHTDESSDEEVGADRPRVSRNTHRPQPTTLDTSLKMWNFGSSTT